MQQQQQPVAAFPLAVPGQAAGRSHLWRPQTHYHHAHQQQHFPHLPAICTQCDHDIWARKMLHILAGKSRKWNAQNVRHLYHAGELPPPCHRATLPHSDSLPLAAPPTTVSRGDVCHNLPRNSVAKIWGTKYEPTNTGHRQAAKDIARAARVASIRDRPHPPPCRIQCLCRHPEHPPPLHYGHTQLRANLAQLALNNFSS